MRFSFMTWLVIGALALSGTLVGLCILSAPVHASSMASTPEPCAVYHTVKLGETLSQIAQANQTTVSELWRLNPSKIMNPNLIRIGQQLCVTTQKPEPQAITYTQAVLDLELKYEQTDGEVELMGTQAGFIGQRTVFPLAANGLQIFKSYAALMAAMQMDTMPFTLYGLRNDETSSATYTLVIQSEKSAPATIFHTKDCELAPQEFYSRSESTTVESATVMFAIETATGLRERFPISYLSQRAYFGATDPCTSNFIDFALLPANKDKPNLYKLFLFHPDSMTDEAAAPTNNRVAIEINYLPQPASDAHPSSRVNPSGELSKRVEYPLQPLDGIQAVTKTEDILHVMRIKTPAPLFYGIRQEDTENYALMAVGNTSAFASLFVTKTQTLSIPTSCTPVPLITALGASNFQNVNMALFLENESGIRFPLHVTEIGYVDTARAAGSCPNTQTAFALFPGIDKRYQFTVVLNENGYGPPGSGRGANCQRWRQGRGFIYRVLRSWWGC